MNRRLYRYIQVHDAGMAPCIDNGLLTLATCKPVVRRSAREGDWIAGFLPRPHPRGLLTYVGRVGAILPVGLYERKYRGRSDAIYRQRCNGSFERLTPNYHDQPAALRKDLSGPVLIFDEQATWYFGSCSQSVPRELMHLAPAGRGHRVSGADERDIGRLERWLRARWPAGMHGLPYGKGPLLTGTPTERV